MSQRLHRSLVLLGAALLTLATLVGVLLYLLRERNMPPASLPRSAAPRSTTPPSPSARVSAGNSRPPSEATHAAPTQALVPTRSAPLPSTLTPPPSPTARRRPDPQRHEATQRVRLVFLRKRLALARHELELAEREGASPAKQTALRLQRDQIQSTVRKTEARLRANRRTVPTDPAQPPHYRPPRMIPGK